MSTRRQRRAARRNGMKSQGPVTPEGKARSATNATRHGLASAGRLSHSVCLTIESREEFHALHQTFIDLYRPANAGEHLIVEEITVARWRMQRGWVMETALYEDQMDEMTEAVDRDYDNISEPRRLTLAYKQLTEKSPSLGNLQRCETRLSRQIQRCQKHLADLRTQPALTPTNHDQLSNFPIEPNPTIEHQSNTPELPDPTPPAANPPAQTEAGGVEQQSNASPAVASSPLAVLPGRSQLQNHEERPELPPSLPRAA